jgi:NDP-sugar pyrophosphorylase family protein
VYRNGEIVVYDKKVRLSEMRHIDYGLSLFQASAFDAYAAGQVFDLAQVMGRLVADQQLAGYEVPERFYEMGSPAGLAELENLLRTRPGK